jgi:hypothetical protein
MSEFLTMPTVENVLKACAFFGNDKNDPDPALIELFTKYPKNDNFDHVLLKVVTLNTLYSLRIRVYSDHPTVYDVARHIVGQKIDSDLDHCLPELVHRISKIDKGKKTFYHYSFATKYCSFHRPESYPIWDSRVDEYLGQFRNQEKHKQGGFRQFKKKDLWNYPEFRKIVTEFRDHYGLQDFKFKQIDGFLFYEGGKLLERKEKLKSAAADSQQHAHGKPKTIDQ